MYVIRYVKQVTDIDIPNLPKSAHALIKRAIDTRLVAAPMDYGKPLRRNRSGHRRLRVSDYRIIYRIDEAALTVYIVTIQHRKEVYD